MYKIRSTYNIQSKYISNHNFTISTAKRITAMSIYNYNANSLKYKQDHSCNNKL